MSENERVAALERENVKLKEDNEMLLDIIVQMKGTLNRLINRYIIDSAQ